MNFATASARCLPSPLGFWITKIAATTLGETGSDAVTMSTNLGYLVGTAIFAVFFVAAVAARISVRKYYPFLYWATINTRRFR